MHHDDNEANSDSVFWLWRRPVNLFLDPDNSSGVGYPTTLVRISDVFFVYEEQKNKKIKKMKQLKMEPACFGG